MASSFAQRVQFPATLSIPIIMATFALGNGAKVYRPDFLTVPTDSWLIAYWLLLCGTLIYLLGYGSRALLVLRGDPRSRRIANLYLAASASGILACVIRVITAYDTPIQALEGGKLVCLLACTCGAGFALASAHSWRVKLQWFAPARTTRRGRRLVVGRRQRRQNGGGGSGTTGSGIAGGGGSGTAGGGGSSGAGGGPRTNGIAGNPTDTGTVTWKGGGMSSGGSSGAGGRFRSHSGHGNPLPVKGVASPAARFSSSCWVWPGGTASPGSCEPGIAGMSDAHQRRRRLHRGTEP